jgi:hypothetical protein
VLPLAAEEAEVAEAAAAAAVAAAFLGLFLGGIKDVADDRSGADCRMRST